MSSTGKGEATPQASVLQQCHADVSDITARLAAQYAYDLT